jgi:hypothetical protein
VSSSSYVGFEFLTAVNIKTTVFQDVATCIFVGNIQKYGGILYFQIFSVGPAAGRNVFSISLKKMFLPKK